MDAYLYFLIESRVWRRQIFLRENFYYDLLYVYTYIFYNTLAYGTYIDVPHIRTEQHSTLYIIIVHEERCMDHTLFFC